MLRHSIGLLGILTPIVAFMGCDGSSSAPRETLLRAGYPPHDIVIGGKWLVRRGPAKLRTGEKVTKEAPVPPDIEERDKVDRLSLEELADRLRLVTLYEGYEYIEAEPDINRAAEMRANKGHEVITPPGSPHVAPLTSITEGRSIRAIQRAIIGGTDNRVIAWDNTTVPYNSYLALNFVSNTCGAVSIGTHTAITAGRCVYNNGAWSNFDPSNPGDPSYIAPGANIGQAPPSDFPWGKFTCYQPWVYNAWVSTGSAFWDMAVIDFSACPNLNNPGWVAGYNGSWANMYFSGTKVVTVFGYPAGCPAPFIGFPQVCGMGGTAYLYPIGDGLAPYVYSGEIDTSAGTSGASWTYKNPSNNYYYTIGTHKGYNWDWFYGYTNYARRLANEYWDLVVWVSVDF
jgi:hypothetical protein